MKRLLLALVLPLAVAACSKHDEARTKKLADLCVKAGHSLESAAAENAGADTFESLLESTIEACSQACDGDDQPSCRHLDDHLDIMCKAMPDACTQLCDGAHSDSLKKGTCARAAAKT